MRWDDIKGWLLPIAIGMVIGLFITVPGRSATPHHSDTHHSHDTTVTSIECDDCGYENLHHYHGRKTSDWHDADEATEHHHRETSDDQDEEEGDPDQ